MSDEGQSKTYRRMIVSNPAVLSTFGRLFRFYSVSVRQRMYDLRSALSKSPGIPELKVDNVRFTLVSSTTCNSNCTYCAYRFLPDDEKAFMPLDFAKRVIDEYAALGGKEIFFTPIVGESLLDPTLFEKIAYARSKGLQVGTLFTNGIELNNHEIFDKLKNADVPGVQFDLGDIDTKYYAESFGISEFLAEKTLLEIIDFILKRPKSMKVTLAFRTGRSFRQVWNAPPPNAPVMGVAAYSMIKAAYKLGLFDVEYQHAYDNWCGRVKQSDLHGEQRLRNVSRIRKYPCGALWSLNVLPDGDVRLCCNRFKNTLHKDELVIGNLNSLSVKQLFKSEKWREIVDYYKCDIPEQCKECSCYSPKLNMGREERK